jgi:hypothetical protein
MAVNFTPNLGLAKPTDVELAEDWVNNTKLIEDNNLILVDKMNIVMTAYTPTFIALTTNPSVGAGSILGEYYITAGMVFGSFVLRCLDPGVLPGTGVGSYGISLPVLADTTFHTVATALPDLTGVASCIGEGYITDSSSIPNSGTVALELAHIGGVAYMRPLTEFYPGKTQRWHGPGLPYTLATTDGITGTFMYKAA